MFRRFAISEKDSIRALFTVSLSRRSGLTNGFTLLGSASMKSDGTGQVFRAPRFRNASRNRVASWRSSKTRPFVMTFTHMASVPSINSRAGWRSKLKHNRPCKPLAISVSIQLVSIDDPLKFHDGGACLAAWLGRTTTAPSPAVSFGF